LGGCVVFVCLFACFFCLFVFVLFFSVIWKQKYYSSSNKCTYSFKTSKVKIVNWNVTCVSWIMLYCVKIFNHFMLQTWRPTLYHFQIVNICGSVWAPYYAAVSMWSYVRELWRG
jgi:hypothetical protein